MTGIRLTIRFIAGLVASVAIALVVSAAALASPGAPCAEAPIGGQCVPVGGAQPSYSQTYGDFPLLAQLGVGQH